MKRLFVACLLMVAGILSAAEWDFSEGMPSSFAFEAEFVPRPNGTNGTETAATNVPARHHVLWDAMGANAGKNARHKGLQVLFVEANGRWTPRLYAGFGDQTVWVAGPSFKPQDGEMAKLSIRYRMFGRVEWSMNGTVATNRMKRCDPILSDPKIRPVIGDRLLAPHMPFNGDIRRVSIQPLPLEPVIIRPAARQAFERGEEGATFLLDVVCHVQDLTGVTVSAEQRDVETGASYSSMRITTPSPNAAGASAPKTGQARREPLSSPSPSRRACVRDATNWPSQLRGVSRTATRLVRRRRWTFPWGRHSPKGCRR